MEDFNAEDGDAWFKRNAGKLDSKKPGEDDIFRLVESSGIRPSKALEIGCANGYRLEWLRQSFGCTCFGLDISGLAVDDGNRRYPQLSLIQGKASRMGSFDSGQFDLIIANYVLHYVARDELFGVFNEMNRCLAVGGHLVIGDFYPEKPHANEYSHRAGLKIFKARYDEIFEASGIYQAVRREIKPYRSIDPSSTSAEECAYSILKKTM